MHGLEAEDWRSARVRTAGAGAQSGAQCGASESPPSAPPPLPPYQTPTPPPALSSPHPQQTVDGESSIDANLPGINGGPMDFETAAAKGRMQVHIRGVKSTRAGVFDGKKRFVHVAVQVRVKRPLAVSSVCIGQELYNDVAIPLWMRQVLLGTAAKAFSSTARVEADGTPRYFMNPVLAACQLVNVALPGQDPDIWDCREDVRLLLPACADKDGRPLPAERRRKWCDVEANVAGAALVPDHVYTFHFWQHYANFGDYKLSLVREYICVRGAVLGGVLAVCVCVGGGGVCGWEDVAGATTGQLFHAAIYNTAIAAA